MKHKTLKQLALTLYSIFSTAAFFQSNAQAVKTPVEEWTVTRGTQNIFYKSKSITDGSGNVYTCGATVNNAGNYDILVTKHNSSGIQQWAQQYAGAGNGDDGAQGIYVDGSGNVFITGSYYANSTDSNNVITIKYNSSGVQQWAATYNGAGSRNDAGSNIIPIGSTGDIAVVGAAYTNSTDKHDMLVIRYNSSGQQVWVSTWDYNNLDDVSITLSYSSFFGITIGGVAGTSATNYQYCTVRFNAGTGAYVTHSFAGSSSPVTFSKFTGLVSDAGGNIYITGAVTNNNGNFDYYTVKYTSALAVVWTAQYNGPGNLNDIANDIQVDGVGNVYVTGYSTTAAQGKNIVTIKYNSSGAQQWAVSYNGRGNAEDEGTALAINNNNDVYLTGWSNNGDNHDFITMKLDPVNGNAKWNMSYNHTAAKDDKATDICVDFAGNIVVTGQCQQANGTLTYLTVKYLEKDIITPPDTLAGNWQYIENRGQLMGTNSQAASTIKFYNDQSSPQVYFSSNAMSYVLSGLDTNTTDTDTLTRVDLTFTGAVNTRMYPLEKRNDHFSYFKPHINSQGGRGMVPLYKRLIIPELYGSIDVMYASNTKGMRMYFLIKGGKPSDIQLTYNGANSVTLGSNGELIIATSLGNIVHPKATAYEISSSGSRVNLSWQPTYSIVSANNIKFANIGTYNTSNTLVLEVNLGTDTQSSTIQNLQWCTYYGGSNHDNFRDVKVASGTGDAITCGMTYSSDFPITAGVFQDSLLGGQDVVVVKFDSAGVRQWATFYGGTGNEYGRSLVSDTLGDNIVVTGQTNSPDFPTYDSNPLSTAGNYYDSTCNGSDIFLFKLNSLGSLRLWSTFYGGTGGESVAEVVKDPYNNLYVLGASNGNFPTQTKAGAYNATSNTQGGMILKFNSSDSLIWATSFGLGIIKGAIHANGRLYITGSEYGALPLMNYPGAYYDPSFNGSTVDAFITAFNINDTLEWSTYFGGTSSETGEGLGKILAPGDQGIYDIVVVGNTSSPNFPYYTQGGGAFIDSTYSGSSDCFIARFGFGCDLKWCTLYGGTASVNSDVALDVVSDKTAFYVVGATSSDYGFSLSQAPNAYWDYIHAGVYYEGFIMSYLNSSNKRLWATYFGGPATDWSYGVDVDPKRKNLFMVGVTNSLGPLTFDGFPVTDNTSTSNDYQDFLLNGPNSGQGNTTWSDGFIALFGTSAIHAVSVDEISPNFNYEIGVFPNPSDGYVNVSVLLAEKQDIRIELYNLLGELIKANDLGQQEGEVFHRFDLSAQAPGMYVVRVKMGDKSISRKVIKQN
jgi:hypothetical protein